MGIPKPRGDDVEWLDTSNPPFETWIRTPAYKNSHMRSVGDDSLAKCGTPLVIDEDGWDEFRVFMRRALDVRVDEWWMAVDTRKTGQCGACARKDRVAELLIQHDSANLGGRGESFESPAPEDYTYTKSAADRLLEARFNAKVGQVARELGAVIVNDG